MATIKRSRVTYKRVQAAVAAWNTASGFVWLGVGKGYTRGYMELLNDGDVHFLGQISHEGTTRHLSLIGTDGSLRSCLQRIQGLPHGDTEALGRVGLPAMVANPIVKFVVRAPGMAAWSEHGAEKAAHTEAKVATNRLNKTCHVYARHANGDVTGPYYEQDGNACEN